jgi:hypothetical protein
MGIQQSFISCDDENRKCSYQRKSYPEYDQYVNSVQKNDPNREKKIKEFVCGNKKGKIAQCCDRNSINANMLANGSNLINPVMDSNGDITEYQICKCTSSVCEEIGCKGFRTPTNYELCKARSVDPSNVISINEYIDKISFDKTYPDCYDTCQ